MQYRRTLPDPLMNSLALMNEKNNVAFFSKNYVSQKKRKENKVRAVIISSQVIFYTFLVEFFFITSVKLFLSFGKLIEANRR